MAATAETHTVTIRYGIDEKGNILMDFGQPVQLNILSQDQALAMIEHLQKSLQMSKDYLAGKIKPTGSIPIGAPGSTRH